MTFKLEYCDTCGLVYNLLNISFSNVCIDQNYTIIVCIVLASTDGLNVLHLSVTRIVVVLSDSLRLNVTLHSHVYHDYILLRLL